MTIVTSGPILANKVQQTLLRQAQHQLLRQAQQALPNWPKIYKFAAGNNHKVNQILFPY